MRRLTNDEPTDNFSTILNYVYVKSGWAYIRSVGEIEAMPLTDWAKAQCIKHGCNEFPAETQEEIDEVLTECIMDSEGCPVALAYCFASQACHLRSRLKAIEDVLGDEYDLEHLRVVAPVDLSWTEHLRNRFGPD